MKDGINLARLLAGTETPAVVDALKKYQAEMLPRGADAVKRSRNALYDDEAATH
jgi:2-polyprenyl-6-methoxyphenol hydroxylase-like FAD-dependent oxidoreductase